MTDWCPKCRAMLAPGAGICPRCGKKLPGGNNLGWREIFDLSRYTIGIALIPVGLFILAGFICILLFQF